MIPGDTILLTKPVERSGISAGNKYKVTGFYADGITIGFDDDYGGKGVNRIGFCEPFIPNGSFEASTPDVIPAKV